MNAPIKKSSVILAVFFAAILVAGSLWSVPMNANAATDTSGVQPTPAKAAKIDNEDPHTEVTGNLEITKETKDGHTHTTYIFTSNDLKNKYGYSTLLRVVDHHLQDENAQAYEKEVHKDMKMKVVDESEIDKVDKYQKAKNNGIPMLSYMKWEGVEPLGQNSGAEDAITNPILALLQLLGVIKPADATHVQGWAHKSAAYSPYDPINVIWADTQSASTDVLGAATQKMNGNGWTGVSNCLYSTPLYVLIGGTYQQQTAHEYQYDPGTCNGYHVRMWRINSDSAIGAAHKEVVDTQWGDIRHIGGLNTWEDNQFFGHRVIGFENAESTVMNTFDIPSLTCWDTWPNSHSMSNSYTREYWNNARTTMISSAFSGSSATIINQINC